jgi:hypothetical protein
MRKDYPPFHLEATHRSFEHLFLTESPFRTEIYECRLTATGV